MFFHHANQQGPKRGPQSEAKEEAFIAHPSGITIINADVLGLVTKLPDDPSLPVGQLILEHPAGMIDYNDLIDRNLKHGMYADNTPPEPETSEQPKGEEVPVSSTVDSGDIQ